MSTRSFQSCFSTLGCPDLTLPEVLALVEEYDIDCLELRSLEDRIDLPDYLPGLPGGMDGVRKALGSLKSGVRVRGTSYKPLGAREAGREELVKFARVAEEIGAPFPRVFGGGKLGAPLTDENYQEAVDFLNWWQEQRAANGWNAEVVIETHDAFSASLPLLHLFERLGRSVGIIWDSHHTWKLGGESPPESWGQLGEFIHHVHIKDSISKPSARPPYTCVLPGAGEMPMGEVFGILNEEGVAGSVALEWEKMWHPYLADISQALAACRENGWS
jgi:sugar phosphate isomerase/epimerase